MINLRFHTSLMILAMAAWLPIAGQTTIIIENLPANTPGGAEIYISGDFENWSGGREEYKLKPFGDGYSIDLPAVEQDIQFKFTRGNWNNVEVALDGSSLGNRSLSLTQKTDSVRLEIEAWGDLTSKKSTASENVHLLSETFEMGTLPKQRRILIYLPASYEESTKSYPVLYMQDGQNLFDNGTSYTGEWEVDETLDRIAASDGLELIVVGIDHGGQERIDEYVPYKLKSYDSKVEGEDYVRFLTEVLKPYVDKNYRTLANREHTGVMGSSLGGLISFYAAMEFEETFGLAGIFSPSFELIDHGMLDHKIAKPLTNTKIYLMCGDQESGKMVQEMQKMGENLLESGFDPRRLHSEVIKGGKHNEALWKNEFESAIRWLFANEK